MNENIFETFVINIEVIFAVAFDASFLSKRLKSLPQQKNDWPGASDLIFHSELTTLACPESSLMSFRCFHKLSIHRRLNRYLVTSSILLALEAPLYITEFFNDVLWKKRERNFTFTEISLLDLRHCDSDDDSNLFCPAHKKERIHCSKRKILFLKMIN